MVWAAIRGDGSLIFDFPEGDPESKRGGVTARKILALLKDNLPAIMKEDSIFMQDNAPVHTAKIVKCWFEEMGYELLKPWPPNSPDLNPIEHLRFHLKELVYELHPELISMGGDDNTKRTALKAAISHALEAIHDHKPMLIPAACESFQARMEACKLAQGGPTKY